MRLPRPQIVRRALVWRACPVGYTVRAFQQMCRTSGSEAGMSDKALVRHQVSDGVATLTLDSQPNRNALSTTLVAQLRASLERAVADGTVRAIVLTHTGPVFSSGADLAETAAARERGEVPAVALPELLTALWEAPKPVVARVAGPARAGGLGLIAACDIAVCTTECTFAFSEVRLGVIPAVISATVLRRMPARAAAELYLTGATFDGQRAAEIGLVTRAVPAAELDETVAGYLAALKLAAPGALASAKTLLRTAATRPMRAEWDELTALSARHFLSDEGREGVAAFREKRPPAWVSEP